MSAVSDHALLKLLEESLWRDATRFDRDYMGKILAPDFFEVGRSGRVYTREQIIGSDIHPIAATLPLECFKVAALASGIALVTYHIAVAKADGAEWSRRSSIWSKSSDHWTIRFHQGTPFTP